MTTITGRLTLERWGSDSEDVLHISGGALCELLECQISRKCVTIRYWITDQECTPDEAKEAFLRKLYGDAECELNAAYSDYTGYLWTDETLKVGGHDLINELHSHIGKYLVMEVEVHNS